MRQAAKQSDVLRRSVIFSFSRDGEEGEKNSYHISNVVSVAFVACEVSAFTSFAVFV